MPKRFNLTTGKRERFQQNARYVNAANGKPACDTQRNRPKAVRETA